MKLILSLALLIAISPLRSQDSTQHADKRRGPITELRIYEIFERNKLAFHARFRDHAMRIMQRYQFKIVSIWESQGSDKVEFIYLLEWPDEKTMMRGWERFRADREWIEIKKQTVAESGELLGKIEDRVLVKTAYSPNR